MEGYSQFMVSSYSKNNDNAVRQTTGAKPPAVDLGVLHNASNILVEQHSKDAQIVPDFGDLISSCTFFAFLFTKRIQTIFSRDPGFRLL